jgi:hypothetical protein
MVKNVAVECRRDSGMVVREKVVRLSSRTCFMGDVRGVAVMVPSLGPSCNFSRILSAALDFRAGCLDAVGSLCLYGGVSATSGDIEGMICEGSDGRPWRV